MATNVIIRHATYGLELVDALTGGPLLSGSSVTVVGSLHESFVASGSRWIFEGLPAGPASFSVTAPGYVSLNISTTDIGADVPAMTVPGVLARVLMMPRTGYPFPATLTRIVGQVFVASSVDPSTPPVAGATITVTPQHRDAQSVIVDGPDITVQTTEDGQYTCWFFPDPSKDPPLANELIIHAQLGLLNAAPLTVTTVTPHAVTGVPSIHIS